MSDALNRLAVFGRVHLAGDDARRFEDILADLRREQSKLHARCVVAEQHKILDRLGKSSYQEVVEEQLRVKLAEAEARAEQAEADIDNGRELFHILQKQRDELQARLDAYEGALEQLRDAMTVMDACWERPPLNYPRFTLAIFQSVRALLASSPTPPAKEK